MYLMDHANLVSYQGKVPELGPECFVASGAQIIGDVVCGADTSFWFNCVVRADCNSIRIGARTNIQDGTVIHVTQGTGPVSIGHEVTIGHNATIHACTIHDLALIGMHAVLLDGCEIKRHTIVAAGSVVAPGKKFPEGVMIMGAPAKIVRALTKEEIEGIHKSYQYYLEYKTNYISNISNRS